MLLSRGWGGGERKGKEETVVKLCALTQAQRLTCPPLHLTFRREKRVRPPLLT